MCIALIFIISKDAGRLDFEVAARPRLMKFQKKWNSKKIHIKFQKKGGKKMEFQKNSYEIPNSRDAGRQYCGRQL